MCASINRCVRQKSNAQEHKCNRKGIISMWFYLIIYYKKLHNLN